MSGFADLLMRAHPALVRFPDRITAGTPSTWTFLNPMDNDGNVIDLTAATGVCHIVDSIGGAVLATPTFAGGLEASSVSVTAAQTASLVTDGRRNAYWSLLVTSGGVGPIPFWITDESPLVLLPAS